ncbi:MAG TPA: tRNA pseudouridine(38-40) synthase TruA [Haploplasma sp.]|nr:tRNA pseudouridine(38-40) synthase TruA [Haploplasma sp.]
MSYRYLCTVSYDGSNYKGFQRQIGFKTVQEEIEKAIKNMTKQVVTIHSAGRTDSGVHAIGQKFHFDLDVKIDLTLFLKGINKRLNSDIIIKNVKYVKNTFHARHHAKLRTYQYRISKKPSNIFNQSFEVYIENFDMNKALECVKMFIGTKDFTGFAKLSKDKNPIRTITSIKTKETRTHYIFEFEGVSFLRYMIRSIMGTIIEVATNKKEIEVINEIFETNNRKLAGMTAPAKGLYFMKVTY